MKRLIFIFILFICPKIYSQGQSKFQKQIDSLKVIKSECEINLQKINLLIKEIEGKKIITEFESFESLNYVVQAQPLMKIRDRGDSSGNIMFQPKAGESIKLIDYNASSDYWLVSYKNVNGFVNGVYIEPSSTINDFKKYLVVKKTQIAEENKRIEEQKAEERRILKSQQDAERRKIEDQQAVERIRLAKQKATEDEKKHQLLLDQKRKELIKKYGTDSGTKISEGKIWIGMTDKMARESWGDPDENNRSVGSWGVHEQWIYERYNTYVYFENGILTSWQDSK